MTGAHLVVIIKSKMYRLESEGPTQIMNIAQSAGVANHTGGTDLLSLELLASGASHKRQIQK